MARSQDTVDSKPLPPPPLVGRYPQGFNPYAAPADQRGGAPIDLAAILGNIAQTNLIPFPSFFNPKLGDISPISTAANPDPNFYDQTVFGPGTYERPVSGGITRILQSPLARTIGQPSQENTANPLNAALVTGGLIGPASESLGFVGSKVARGVADLSPAKAAGSFAESMGLNTPARVTAQSVAPGADQSGIAAKLAAAEKAPLTKLTGRAATDAAGGVGADVSIAPRFTVDVGKSRSLVKDTTTGETLPSIFMGPDHAANAAADAASRNAHVVVSDGAKAAAQAVVPPTSSLRNLTTPQLTALHNLEGTTPTDRQAIDALLGERAFSLAPDEKIKVAANLFDREVATNIRRAQRGIDTDLTGVQGAIDKAIKEAGVEATDVNRAAVLQKVMDDQAAANVRNPAVNAARAAKRGGGGGGTPPPTDALPPPPPEPPVPPEVTQVVGQRGPAREVYESIRSLKSFVDVATGRQGIRVVGNPVAFAKSAVAALQGYKGGPKLVTKWLDGKQADPLWDTFVNKMKIEFTNAEGVTVKGAFPREEAFPGGAIERTPILGGALEHSNAAYTHGLNVARWEKAKGDLQQAEFLWKHLFKQTGPLPDSELAALGRNVNVATGRGQLGRLSGVGNELGTAFFSPRNTISWPQFFTDWALHIKDGNPVAAAIQAKTLVTFLGFSIGALKANELISGQPVETDPRSSDFLKVINGDQRTDIMGGGQQWMVALSRLATGESKDLAGKVTATTPGDVLGAFVLNRSHPALGTILSASDLALTTARRAVEGKPFTGVATDPQGNQFGILETLLGATAPMVAAGFIDAVRFEMNADHKSLTQAMADVAPSTAVQFFGFGGGRYRAGVKTPPMGGGIGSGTPEVPVRPEQILLSGNLQKQQNDLVEKAKAEAKTKVLTSPDYLAAGPDEKVALMNKASSDASQVASKSFGLNLALNGHPDEVTPGALIAWSASPSNLDRAKLLGLLEKSGRATAELKAAIDQKRKQTDPTQPSYDLSADEYIAGSKLVEAWNASPQFSFGNKIQWDAAARGAELLRKTIAEDERKGVKPADDPHIDQIYTTIPFLADFYNKSGSRITKYISDARLAIEKNRLWAPFADGARKSEIPK